MRKLDFQQHTFLFFPLGFALFLGCDLQGLRKHTRAVDADVIKVRLIQEVVLTLGRHAHDSN